MCFAMRDAILGPISSPSGTQIPNPASFAMLEAIGEDTEGECLGVSDGLVALELRLRRLKTSRSSGARARCAASQCR